MVRPAASVRFAAAACAAAMLALLGSCASGPATSPVIAPALPGVATGAAYRQALADAETLAGFMSGAWTSARLAARDSDYLDIRTVNVRIWQSDQRVSGPWFYTESARPSAPETPYRQNVFNLVAQEDGSVHAYQYRVREPARFAGAALRASQPEGLALDDLIPLPGCTLVWRRNGEGRFAGAMRDRQCRNTFRGATWMDGSSWATADQLYTWDRGMDEAGTQIWGPARAGYLFERAAQ
jgi:hypothetical protein